MHGARKMTFEEFMDFESARRHLFCSGLVAELKNKPTNIPKDKVGEYVRDALTENIKALYEDDKIFYTKLKFKHNV